jgi:putative component of membrane protein insertase Oxa1/YidC/SpoIIIJ protein YidD
MTALARKKKRACVCIKRVKTDDTAIVTSRLFRKSFNCRYNLRMDYAFCLLTLKSYEKWWSPLFGATCNFNDQILPYGILFLTLFELKQTLQSSLVLVTHSLRRNGYTGPDPGVRLVWFVCVIYYQWEVTWRSPLTTFLMLVNTCMLGILLSRGKKHCNNRPTLTHQWVEKHPRSSECIM